MFNILQYWLKVDHIKQIKLYGLKSHLQYIFNFNINRIVIHLHAKLFNLPSLKLIPGYTVRELQIYDHEDQQNWIRIVNAAYPDANEDINTFRKHLFNHPFLNITNIFFILKENQPVGTTSIGLFKKNPQIGGDARIAILPSERSKGLGFFLINFGFHYLQDNGIDFGESIITLKREQSISLHFKCGFIPQYNRKRYHFDIQKRMWPTRLIAKLKVKKLYSNYRKHQNWISSNSLIKSNILRFLVNIF